MTCSLYVCIFFLRSVTMWRWRFIATELPFLRSFGMRQLITLEGDRKQKSESEQSADRKPILQDPSPAGAPRKQCSGAVATRRGCRRCCFCVFCARSSQRRCSTRSVWTSSLLSVRWGSWSFASCTRSSAAVTIRGTRSSCPNTTKSWTVLILKDSKVVLDTCWTCFAR